MINSKKGGRPQKWYNLDAIISIGYRINSKEATQFRRWANKILKEYYDLLREQGFVQETEVRFNKSPNVYVIVERYGKKTKIAYHIAR